MEEKLEIKKNGYVLFVVNIITLITLVFFRIIYSQLGFYSLLLNIFLIINIIFLIVGIIFNVLFIKNVNKYDVKKSIIITLIIFFIYLLLNTVGIYFINSQMSKGYSKINSMLSSYCESFGCDKYDTVSGNGYEDFVINKSYYDYDGSSNNLEITVRYNTNGVDYVEAVIYSRNELFSPRIIRTELSDYYDNFNYKISEDKIKEAFDNRFKSSVKDGNATYRVVEIYKNGALERLKTTINLKIN